ncbi:MAG: hypothetical protein HYY55_03605 [Candidatus Niyogibacteria bacterium]|nr:MAG: hypothetical protein HYY55_03605 [Candidatus Niyogibacteria bacterium]
MPPKEFDFSRGIPVETPDHLKPTTGLGRELLDISGWFLLIIIGFFALFVIYKISRLISKSYKKLDRYLDK